jgi:predicted TIM-barrel fold metal-dependent hydrolase
MARRRSAGGRARPASGTGFEFEVPGARRRAKGVEMPLQDHMKILSVDDHLVEHPRVWQDRLPEKYKEAGPRIIENEHGHHVWLYEGRLYPQIGLNAVAGREPKDYGMDPVRYDDMIPGCYDPVQRVKDMDLDGVQGAMCYPTLPGFGGSTFFRGEDKTLSNLCVEAWNDFHLDEWRAGAHDRFIPLSIVPFWDPLATTKEIERVAEKGSRAITFPENPVPLGLPSFHTDHWDRVWDACEAANMPVCLHFGSSGFVPGFGSVTTVGAEETTGQPPFAVAIALFATNLMWTTVDLLFSPVFHRHPDLKIVLAEGGIGWIPYIIERTDYTWFRHRWYQDIDRETRPSDLFKKHFYGCFIDDEHGVENRHVIGVDNITLEVDYPHSDSTWPNSRRRAAEVLADVPDDEVHKIVELNTRKLFNFYE